MNKNLYLKELKRNRKNLITWSAITVGFTVLLLAIYPSMEDMGKDLTTMMEKLPAELGKALGMDANTWSNVLGFYSTYFGIYIVLLIGIFTMSTGATIISKEERDGTSEFLFTKPITRATIFKTKTTALFTLMAIIIIVQLLSAIVMLLVVGKNVDWHALAVMQFHGIILILFFTCLGQLISFYFEPKRNFMGMVVGIIFGCYFINAISKTSESVEWLGYISPFHYLDFTPLDPGYDVNWIGTSSIVAISIGLVMYSKSLLLKKDLRG